MCSATEDRRNRPFEQSRIREIRTKLLEGLELILRALEQQISRIGQHNAARMPFHQCRVQFALEQLDLPGQRRLRDVKLESSLTERVRATATK